MSFCNGFTKVAATQESISKVLTELINLSKGVGRGIKSSGGISVGDALKLKALKHVPEALAAHGGLTQAVKSPQGRLALAEGLGKSAPSLAATGLYGGLAYKAYQKATDNNSNNPYNSYYGY